MRFRLALHGEVATGSDGEFSTRRRIARRDRDVFRRPDRKRTTGVEIRADDGLVILLARILARTRFTIRRVLHGTQRDVGARDRKVFARGYLRCDQICVVARNDRHVAARSNRAHAVDRIGGVVREPDCRTVAFGRLGVERDVVAGLERNVAASRDRARVVRDIVTRDEHRVAARTDRAGVADVVRGHDLGALVACDRAEVLQIVRLQRDRVGRHEGAVVLHVRGLRRGKVDLRYEHRLPVHHFAYQPHHVACELRHLLACERNADLQIELLRVLLARIQQPLILRHRRTVAVEEFAAGQLGDLACEELLFIKPIAQQLADFGGIRARGREQLRARRRALTERAVGRNEILLADFQN